MNKIYAVCESLQSKEIKEYCFKKCGRIIIGGLDFADMAWWPCRTDKCPYLVKEVSMGDTCFEWGNEELIARKLISLDQPVAADFKGGNE